MPDSIPNFNFLARLVSEIADNFLYRALVRVNAYKCAKFQLPSSISYGDMEGVPKYKWALLISPDAL